MTDYKVKVGFDVDSSGLNKVGNEVGKVKENLKGVGNEGKKAADGISGGFKGIPPSLAGVTTGIAGIATAAASAAAAVGGIAAAALAAFNVIKNELAEIHKLNDIAFITGSDIESLAEFAAVAQTAGVGIDAVQAAAHKSQRAIKDAIADNKELADTFSGLGIVTRDIAKLEPIEAMKQIIFALNKETTSAAVKAEGLKTILGGQGTQLLEIAKNAEEYGARLEDAHNLGTIATADQLAKAEELDDAYNEIATAVLSLKRSLLDAFGDEVVQAIGTIAGLINDLAANMDNTSRAFDAMQIQATDLNNLMLGPSGWIAILNNMVMRGGTAYVQGPGQFDNVRSSASSVDHSAQAAAKAAADKAAAEAKARAEQNRTDAEIAAAAAKAKAAADKAAAEEQRRATEALTRFREGLQRISDLREANKEGLARLTATSEARVTAYASQGDSYSPETTRLMGAFESLASIAESLGVVFKGHQLIEDAIPGLPAPNDIIIPTEFKLSAGTRDFFEKSFPDAAVAAEKIAEYIGLVNDRIAKEGVKIIEEGQTERAKTLYELMTGIGEEVQMQGAITAAITNGQIRSQEELNRFTATQGRIISITNQLKGSGVELTAKETEELRAQLEILENSRKSGERQLEQQIKMNSITEGFIDGVGNSLASSISQGLQNGRMEFDDFLKDISRMLIDSSIKMLFAKLFEPDGANGGKGWLGYIQQGLQLFGVWNGATGGTSTSTTASKGSNAPKNYALGGAFANGVEFFANGSVVNRATGFGMANGRMGIMGEAGPEAIMPLTRGPNGKLGVAAHGGGGSTVINLGDTTINVQSTADTARDDRETAKAIDKMLEQKMAKFLAEQRRSGNSMNTAFGAKY